MSYYIDAMVAAVPTKNKDAYYKHAREIDAIFIKHGAIEVVENWGVNVPDGAVTSFLKAVQCQENETVVIAWIRWPSQEKREFGFSKAMKEMGKKMESTAMPFDGKRLMFGGFNTLFSLKIEDF